MVVWPVVAAATHTLFPPGSLFCVTAVVQLGAPNGAISQQDDFRGKVLPGDYEAAGVAGAQHQMRITTLHTIVTIKKFKITRQQQKVTLPVRV